MIRPWEGSLYRLGNDWKGKDPSKKVLYPPHSIRYSRPQEPDNFHWYAFWADEAGGARRRLDVAGHTRLQRQPDKGYLNRNSTSRVFFMNVHHQLLPGSQFLRIFSNSKCHKPNSIMVGSYVFGPSIQKHKSSRRGLTCLRAGLDQCRKFSIVLLLLSLQKTGLLSAGSVSISRRSFTSAASTYIRGFFLDQAEWWDLFPNARPHAAEFLECEKSLASILGIRALEWAQHTQLGKLKVLERGERKEVQARIWHDD